MWNLFGYSPKIKGGGSFLWPVCFMIYTVRYAPRWHKMPCLADSFQETKWGAEQMEVCFQPPFPSPSHLIRYRFSSLQVKYQRRDTRTYVSYLFFVARFSPTTSPNSQSKLFSLPSLFGWNGLWFHAPFLWVIWSYVTTQVSYLNLKTSRDGRKINLYLRVSSSVNI